MGQSVYVLMELSGREWHPVAVVTDPTVAEQWQQYGKNVDWVPLELDDTRYLQPGEKPEFKPHKMTPLEQRAVEIANRLEQSNQKLMKIIESLQKQLGGRGKIEYEPEEKRNASDIDTSSS